MENDHSDGERNDLELVPETLKIWAIPLLYMNEYIQKNIDFYWRAVKIDGMAVAWDVFDVCDGKILLMQ